MTGKPVTSPPGAVRHPSAFAPLANPAFRGLWIANLLSNIGGWMQGTGAAWEMTSLFAWGIGQLAGESNRRQQQSAW